MVTSEFLSELAPIEFIFLVMNRNISVVLCIVFRSTDPYNVWNESLEGFAWNRSGTAPRRIYKQWYSMNSDRLKGSYLQASRSSWILQKIKNFGDELSFRRFSEPCKHIGRFINPCRNHISLVPADQNNESITQMSEKNPPHYQFHYNSTIHPNRPICCVF